MDVSPEKTRPSPLAEPQDELSRIRTLLQPPPIPDVVDWGIPEECALACDPALQVCIESTLPCQNVQTFLMTGKIGPILGSKA